MCGGMTDIQSPTAEFRRGKKKRKKEETTGQKHNVRICYTQGGHKKDEVYFDLLLITVGGEPQRATETNIRSIGIV